MTVCALAHGEADSRYQLPCVSCGAQKPDGGFSISGRKAVVLGGASANHLLVSARFVGQQAVQLHGGIGVTEELIVGHYFKRLTLINTSFGNADYHLGRFSEMMVAEHFAAAGEFPRQSAH